MSVAERSKNTTKTILTIVAGVILVAVIVLLIILLTLKNGFVVDTNDAGETVVYYYVNGEKQVGWQVIGDNKYYFDTDGTMHTGWLTLGDSKYYFRKGDPANGDVSGWLLADQAATIAGKYYEFDKYGRVTLEVPVID